MDFVIFYESISRELESIVLLKHELIKRGYSVEIINEHSFKKLFFRPKVILTPFLYSNKDVKLFNFFLFKKIKKIVNLQWEQVLGNISIQNGFHIPKEDAKKAIHLSWGEATVKRLTDNNISSENISITGNMSLDFNKIHFNKYHLTKKDLGVKYSINTENTWYLFISSFAWDENAPEESVIDLDKRIHGLSKLRPITIESKENILKWITSVLETKKHISIIYRPHPNEKFDFRLKTLMDKYTNFHCISDYSIRQWVSVSDKIDTWISTSIIDAFFADKNCNILRPNAVPNDFEPQIMYKSKNLTTYSNYMKTFEEDFEHVFPIKKEVIDYYYGDKTRNINSYKNVADVCERVIKSREFNFKFIREKGIFKCIRNILIELMSSSAGTMKIYQILPQRYRLFFQKKYNEKKRKRKLEKEYTIRILKTLR